MYSALVPVHERGEEVEENPPNDIRIIFVYQRHRNDRSPVEIITVSGRRCVRRGRDARARSADPAWPYREIKLRDEL